MKNQNRENKAWFKKEKKSIWQNIYNKTFIIKDFFFVKKGFAIHQKYVLKS